IAVCAGCLAEEGMYLPHQIPSQAFQKMQEMGFQLTKEDLFSTDKPSLSQAVFILGGGTGSFVSPKGLILTNHHVAGGASKIEVLLPNGSRYTARLIGTDPKTDLAVIKISTKEPLPYVTFGDSDKVEVGEWVVAIGHPRGLDQTVTQGIVSAKHRRGITDPNSYQDFLQTDAAINPGNSGGPLLNLRGEVIGVNAAIVSESGGFEGIGFTIPSNMALHIAKTLILHGKVERGWLGATVQDLTPETAKDLRVEALKGARVAEVIKGGPAERGGIRKDDIILTYKGKEVLDSAMLRNEVASTPTGEEVSVTVLRGGKRQELVVKVGSAREAVRIMAATVKQRLGVEVRAVTNKEAEKYGLDDKEGVMVTWLDKKGPLQKAGFEVGDLILEINGQAIRDFDSFIELVSLLRARQQITLLAVDHRTGQSGYVQVLVQ
ncbi:MAG: trypsin-like peptidase domain-containing protein, partial [candidate division KSB1 bacterium]|nr:trypsin-like peptidase domain-containing protein [candidate division KSB1 bacterium]